MNNEEVPTRLLQALASQTFQSIVIFSGAGMSADSGVPTFRSGSNGLWSHFDPQQLATKAAWKNDKALVWGWYEWRRGLVMAARPHPGHFAISQLQQRLGAKVVTQNIDDLHERAGAVDVLHLHGSLFTPRCAACHRPHQPQPRPPTNAQLRQQPPQCCNCGGYVRPGVVWFGENLDPTIWRKACLQVRECDLLLIVGTSGLVYPAADLVKQAPESAVILDINPQPTEENATVEFRWPVTAEVGLLKIADLLTTLKRDHD
jgi:NAD-dependent deacetylase